MSSTKKGGFLSTDKERLTMILALTVLFPVFVGSLFVLFLFLILPAALSTWGSTPMVMHPGLYIHGYWLISALIWLVLLAIFLPLMSDESRSDKLDKTISYKRVSGISMKEYSDTNQHKKSIPIDQKAIIATTLLKAASDISLDKISIGNESFPDRLADSQDEIKVSNSEDCLAVPTEDGIRDSSVSLSERRKLTKSGEFLNDCLQKSFQSEDDLQGEIILGNTNCQVHTRCDDKSDDNDSADKALSDTDSCKEIPCQKTDRNSIRNLNSCAEVEKTEPLIKNQTTINEAINEAITEVDDDLPPPPTALELQEDNEGETVDELPSVLRQKSKALPSLDTSRASQVLCSAPSTLSPRESNMVFLYVNADKE